MSRLLLWGLLIAVGCGDDDGGPRDAGGGTDTGTEDDAGGGGEDAGSPGPDAGPPCDGPPGLYSDPGCSVVSADLRAFAPRYVLWSDAADKERFVFLPPGATIDTTDPNHWVFPTGTRFYKTFLRDGMRLETRILEKTMDGTGVKVWSMRVYVWNEEQNAVTEAMDGVTDVLGTTHDVPPQAFCQRCHSNGQPDVGLGFQALQLNHADTGVSLQDLIDEGLLSTAIDPAAAEIPTMYTTGGVGGGPSPEVTRAALGYMHANCGQCHGGEAPQAGLVMFVDLGLGTVEETGTWTTGVGQVSRWMDPMGDPATIRIVPGNPSASVVHVRMNRRGDGQMPPIATEYVDMAGVAAVDAWISALTP